MRDTELTANTASAAVGSDRLSHRERLETVFGRGAPDRTPVLGGWIACPEHICTLVGITFEQYWRDPVGHSLEAYRRLGTDGLISVFVPTAEGSYRCVDEHTYLHARGDLTLDQAIAQVDALASGPEVEASFDLEAQYAEFRAELVEMQRRCGDMVWMPAQWSIGFCAAWYGALGYENFFQIVGLYPDRARRLFEHAGAAGRCRARLVARAVQEGLYPHAILIGEDICTQRGPMISPRVMERDWAPQIAYSIEPLLEAGCAPVWHSDGDIRPIFDLLLAAGIQGFQGFQPECGLTLDWLVQHRTREGRGLLIFGPLAVTTELPVLPAAEVKARALRAIEVCHGAAHLALFTSNTICPDVPLENIRAIYEAAFES